MVLYLNPRAVTVAPPVDVILPFRVAVVAPTGLAAEVATEGAAMQEEVVCVRVLTPETQEALYAHIYRV